MRKFDSLVRIIEAADSQSFRQIALECLSIRGYAPSVTDGPYDGGTDLRLFRMPPNPTQIAVQVTVQRDWKKKLGEDASKVRNKLGSSQLLFVTSRRIPEEEFELEKDDIWRRLDILVTRLDVQGIASTYISAGQTARVLDILGVDTSPIRTPDDPKSATRKMAAAAYVFFGSETGRFRDEILKSCINAVLAPLSDGLERNELVRRVTDLIGLPPQQWNQVGSVIDRSLPQGVLSVRDGKVVLDPIVAQATFTAQTLREHDWLKLKDRITGFLSEWVPRQRVTDEVVDAIIDDLGAVLLQHVRDTVGALTRIDSSVVGQTIKERLRHLHTTLDIIDFPADPVRSEQVIRLASEAGNSEVGKQVMAGELFLTITSLETPFIVRALGGEAAIDVYLDTSVAIPLLCSVLYEPSNHRFSIAAATLYQQLVAHDVSMKLPDVYLEEVATHLITAARDYAPVVHMDPDLAASENAFVAHFVGLLRLGKDIKLDTYLEAFGYHPSMIRNDFYSARQELMGRLRLLFERYRIHIVEIPRIPDAQRTTYEQHVEIALYDIGADKAPVLTEHDTRVIVFLSNLTRVEVANVLCTWDRLHFAIRQRLGARWDALNPAILTDIMTLASSSGQGPIVHIATLAKSMNEQAMTFGARVWDAIVRLESGKLYDADIAHEARLFKDNYVRDMHSSKEFEAISQAWRSWRSQRFPHN